MVIKQLFIGINTVDFQQTKNFRIINILIKVSIIQTFQIKVVQNQFLSWEIKQFQDKYNALNAKGLIILDIIQTKRTRY